MNNIAMESYIVISFIGEGSFGRVFKAKHKETDGIVALKVIRKKGRSSKDLKNLKQECDIQQQLNHPNIIRMIDSFDTESELVVVTEYAEKELHSILAKEGCLNEDQVKKITWDLVSALYYLHSHRVLHRDLKPQNVLLDSTGRAKLCDFGLARIMTNSTHILTSIKGTPLYMAPELIEEKPYDHQADLWSLGCIVYELMAGQPPFCTMSIWQLVRMIRHKPVQWPSFISVEARSFLQGLLHKDPVKRMSWPEILEHPFVSGHVLILPEDIQSESPFTQPLTHSQQEAKLLQKAKISSNSRSAKVENEPPKPETRQHDLRNVRVMQALECVPMSDDDSVRATSAFSVRDSLKTDDEDQANLITAANAKLLRHEYNVMNNSNLVVCNLENNMAQLMAVNKKQADLNIKKMDKIDEEKQNVEKTKALEEIKPDVRKESIEIKQKVKSVDTASHSLENPKSSTKCSSDISSGLSKSVPPSYKQKILQFSRDKLRFGSGGNRLTRSIKRSFHFSKSWDKNKGDGRRGSEPNVEIPSIIDDDNEKCSKEDKDEDIEKSEIIDETSDEKDVADNDKILKLDEKTEAKEPSDIELEEWEAFLNSNISEVMDGDVESLTQLNMVSMVVGVVGSAARGAKGGRVCGAVAALLALPALVHTLPRHTLLNIQDVYLEAKVVYNFVAAINTLMKDSSDTDEGAEDRLSGVGRMVEVCSWLCVRSCRAVRQLAAALSAHTAHGVFTTLLTRHSKTPRICLNVVGLLITILQDLPEHADVVEKILFDEKTFNFVCLLEQPSDALTMRVCILISLLCTFSCTAFSAAMESKWSKRETDSLEALHTHCNVTLSRAAKLASKELSNMPFYIDR